MVATGGADRPSYQRLRRTLRRDRHRYRTGSKIPSPAARRRSRQVGVGTCRGPGQRHPILGHRRDSRTPSADTPPHIKIKNEAKTIKIALGGESTVPANDQD